MTARRPRHPAATPSDRRAALHAMLDRALDAQPALEEKLLATLTVVAQRASQPGVMEMFGALQSVGRFVSILDRTKGPKGRRGFGE